MDQQSYSTCNLKHFGNLIPNLLAKESCQFVAANSIDLLHPNVLQFFRSLFYIGSLQWVLFVIFAIKNGNMVVI
jgi:hypothetical protein